MMKPIKTEEQWVGALERIVKRDQIDTQLAKNVPLGEIKARVREYLDQNDLPGLYNLLLRSEAAIEPRRAKVAEALVEFLRELYPQDSQLSVVLTGSGVHGGGLIRRLLGNESESDLDWGIAYSDPKFNDRFEREDLCHLTSRFVRDAGRDVGMSHDFHSCTVNNPRNIYLRNFIGAGDCLERLERYGFHLHGEYDPLLMAFYPTFPVEVGERNRRIALEALAQLASRDRGAWKELTDELKASWRALHTIRDKHVLSPFKLYSNRSRDLLEEFYSASYRFMGATFNQLIDSTLNP